MLMTAVVLPTAFAEANYVDPTYHLNTEMFLRGIDSNGLILVDGDEKLYHTLCDAVEPLAAHGKGKTTHALFEELLKKRRQKCLRFVKTCCVVNGNVSIAGTALQVTTFCKPSILLADPPSQPSLASSQLPPETNLTPVPNYISSSVETERHRCLEKLPPIDLMGSNEFDSLIGQATRYSRWLRFFDKQIGKGTNLSHFRRGLERIIRTWIKSAHFPPNELHAEVLTCVDDSEHAQHAPEVAYRRVRKDLVGQLARDLSLRIDLAFKRDVSSICHARHLQTQSVSLLFERGFDFVNEDGSLRRGIVRIDGASSEHLQQYRQLASYSLPC
jgi:hypothetical protein